MASPSLAYLHDQFGEVVKFVPPGNYNQEVVDAIRSLLKRLRPGGAGGPDGKKSVIAAVAIVWIAGLIGWGWYLSRLGFTIDSIALMLMISSIPMFSAEISPRVLRVVTETLVALATIALFTWVHFGRSGFGWWFFYAAAVILVLETGGHMVEWNRYDAISRLSQWPDLLNPLRDQTELIDTIFRRQQVSYAAVPLGFLIALSIGLWLNYSNAAMVSLGLITIIVIAATIMAFFLVNSFIKICDPMFTRSSTPQPTVAVKAAQTQLQATLRGFSLTIAALSTEGDADKHDLDLSRAATKLREIFLYDSIHNVLLLTAFLAVAANFLMVKMTLVRVSLALIGLTFIFCQLPFAIGQARLKRAVVWTLRPSAEAELSEKLSKIAPLFPAFQLLTTLFTTGAGSLLYFLLDEAVKNRLKLLVA